MQRLKKEIFKNFRITIWSFVVILVLLVASSSWMYYCDMDFITILSALTMFPYFFIEWILSIDINRLVKALSAAGVILILGLLFIRIVLKKNINFRIKPPEKEDE